MRQWQALFLILCTTEQFPYRKNNNAPHTPDRHVPVSDRSADEFFIAKDTARYARRAVNINDFLISHTDDFPHTPLKSPFSPVKHQFFFWI
ncbi:hypothetical protein ABK730_02925 [Klebsiella indica]|uniref:hypothetical protein n=1 Tax=Klebsiella TaxID=570 RepID=UPI00374FE421